MSASCGHLPDRRNGRELLDQRRCDRVRHDLRAGARQGGSDRDGRNVHAGQGGDRKVPIGGEACENEGACQKEGCNRPRDEPRTDIHCRTGRDSVAPSAVASETFSDTALPSRSR